MTGTCKLCGGWGTLDEKGRHYVCVELHKLGQPTPNLGARCSACNGVGRLAYSKTGPALSFGGNSPGKIARALEAWAPACAVCNGRGIVPPSAEVGI